MYTTALLTRKQVMDMWKTQPEDVLNYPVCPHCRDILTELRIGILACANGSCNNKLQYKQLEEPGEFEIVS